MENTNTTSRWKRKIFGLPVIAWIIGFSAVGLAVVGFYVTLSVTGSVSAEDGIDVTYTATFPPAGAIVAPATCGFSITDPDTLDLQMSDALPGSTCSYKVEVTNNGDLPAYLNGFTVTDPALNVYVDNGGGGDLHCGDTIPAGGGVANVVIHVELGMAATPGSSFGFAAGDGVEFGITDETAAFSCA